MIDGTLENLGITTDYQKLQTRIVWLLLGWCILCTSIVYGLLYTAYYYHYDTATAVYTIFMLHYCRFMNLIDDIMIASILR